jgi:hypothetical protein
VRRNGHQQVGQEHVPRGNDGFIQGDPVTVAFFYFLYYGIDRIPIWRYLERVARRIAVLCRGREVWNTISPSCNATADDSVQPNKKNRANKMHMRFRFIQEKI